MQPQVQMPGESHRGPLPELTAQQRELRDALRADVETLAGTIGERNIHRYAEYLQAAEFIERSLTETGYQVQRQELMARGRKCFNLECKIPGDEQADQIVVIGAHYDTVLDCPGANDNGSGVAGLLAIARALHGTSPPRTVRLVAFANEEAPFFHTDAMGSWVYAKRCRQRNENIMAMLSLETIGYYSDQPGSQQYPPPFNAFYPDTGNFIGVVGNIESAELVRQVAGSFRRVAKFPCEGGALPEMIDGVAWSDHSSFWHHGYSAAMITDTAPFRYPHYHQPTDTPDRNDYDRMARVVDGMTQVIRELAGLEKSP
jgi:hypothetical protein